MITLLEIAERAYMGPKTPENDWNIGLFRKMQELVERHGLDYSGPEIFFDVPDDYADRAFQAAIDFLAEMGVYCVTTNRVINLTEDEVREAIREIPGEFTIGSGRDARIIRKREVEDRQAVNVIGGGHWPWPEDVGCRIMKNYAQVLRTDIVEGFNLNVVSGREIRGLPMQVYAMKREAAQMREAVRRAGRPGMAITLYIISTKAAALMAPMNPDAGLRPSDGILLSVLPDTKIEADMIAAAIAYEEYGSYKVNGGAFASIGGFCGGVQGAIIETIVKHLVAWIVYRDRIQYNGTAGRYLFGQRTPNERPSLIWPTFVVHNALSRNSNLIRFGGIEDILFRKLWFPKFGTEAFLLSKAGSAVANTVLGANLNLIGYQTPFDVEFSIDVSEATIKAGIKREEVGEILQKIDGMIEKKYVPEAEDWPIDRRMMAYKDYDRYLGTLERFFDFDRGWPKKECKENAEKVMKDLEDVGLHL